MKSLSVPVHSKDFMIPVYELPMEKTMYGSITRYTIGEPTPGQSTCDKKLMIVGTAGADKTSLINAMINFIFDVKWEDMFRFKVARDESKHDQISIYTVYPQKGSPLDFTLTIIDTPEFQDVSGVEQNDRITQQIQELFKGSYDIDFLNGIALVTSADLLKSGPVKTYAFHSILSTFGNDLAGNMFMMVTSGSDQYSPIITPIKIPFAAYYRFDNSILYARSEVTAYYMNFISFNKFLVVFSNMQSVNLGLTIKVLKTYKELQLKDDKDTLTILVNEAESEVEELEKEEAKIKEFDDDIDNCKDYTSEVKVIEKVKIYDPSNKVVTFCTICEYLCHDSCGYRNDRDKYNCGSMDRRGEEEFARCIKCPKRCFWHHHVSRSYYCREQEELKTITDEEMKGKYYAAKAGKEAAEKAKEKIENHLNKIEEDAIRIINEIKKKLLALDSIRLLPNPLMERQHLHELIKIETSKQRILFYKQQEAILRAKDGVDNLKGDSSDVKKIWYKELTFIEKP